MGKFKVGDRVRVIDNTGAPSRYANGETGLVEETYAGNMVRLAGKSAVMYEHRFEAWRPKVGERVRFLRDSTAGGARYGAAGEAATVAKVYWNPEEVDVKLDVNSGGITFNPSAYVKDLEPLLVTEAAPVAAEVQAAAWTINSAVPGDVVTPTNWSGDFFTDGKPYEVSAASMIRSNHGCEYPLYAVNHGKWRLVTAASTTLTIEAGKFYKTRDGRRVGPSKVSEWPNGDWKSLRELWLFKDDGTSGGTDRKNDLVAEWVDEQPARASNDNAESAAKPRFKVGDRLFLARSFHGSALVGATGTVGPKGMFDSFVDVIWNHDDLSNGQMNGGYFPDYFDHAPASPAIVCLIEDGQPKPSRYPRVHACEGEASEEATRLAQVYKGQKFGVFVLTQTVSEGQIYAHEWQNLAANGNKIGAVKALRDFASLDLLSAKKAVETFIDKAA